MARLSPITIGLSAVMIVFLAAALFLVLRPRHAGRRGDDADLTVLPAPAPASAPAPPVRELTPPRAPAAREIAPASAPVAAVEMPAPAAASASVEDADASPAPPPGRRAVLVVNHNRRLQEADEQVFATLSLPDATRAEVRRINEDYRKRTEGDPGQAAGGDNGNGGNGNGNGNAGSGGGEASAAVAARQDSLRLLLGAGPAKDFETAERAAVLRLRGKYRFEWGRQLRE